VSDLVRGMIDFMNQDQHLGPINLGNDGEFTILELAEKVIQLTHSKSKITFKPLPEDDPLQRKPDLSLARKLINYEPKIKLEEGLIKTIEYFKKRLYA
jgi:UDP-glucuronate decarboxylase